MLFPFMREVSKCDCPVESATTAASAARMANIVSHATTDANCIQEQAIKILKAIRTNAAMILIENLRELLLSTEWALREGDSAA